MDKRPNLNKDISIKDFREFYWLKEELMKFCKEEGLKTIGGKINISNRIEIFLRTGDKQQSKSKTKTKSKSKFDWKTEKLSLDTEVTDNYKNTENVRKFFEEQIGKQFKFDVKFMNWMKNNFGKTLRDAIIEWERIKAEKKSNTKPKEIAPQFEYNRYLRDFIADNPSLNRALGIELWKMKKSTRGDNVYKKEDLKLVEEKIKG